MVQQIIAIAAKTIAGGYHIGKTQLWNSKQLLKFTLCHNTTAEQGPGSTRIIP